MIHYKWICVPNAYILIVIWCHKSWLSKADFTWLIFMSHKVCWIPHYDLAWLIVRTWLRTRESLVYYDWLIVSWLTIVMSYDVMTFAHDSHYESWVSHMWLVWAHDLAYEFWLINGMLCDDSCESSMDFARWLTMSHRGLCNARWWVTRDRVVRRCLYKALGSDQEIGSRTISPSAKKLDFASTRIWTHPVVEFASGQHPVHPMNLVLNFRSQNGHVNIVR